MEKDIEETINSIEDNLPSDTAARVEIFSAKAEQIRKRAELEKHTETILKIEQEKAKVQKLDSQLQEAVIEESKQLKTITADTLLKTEFPETKWLVQDLIPTEGFTAITGAPFSYKSFITEHLAICLATGEPLFNHFPVTQGNILLIDKENAQSLIQDRLRKLGCTPNSNIFILEDPDHYNLRDQTSLQSTIDFIKENKISLVVIDSFVQIHKGDENDSMSVVETFQLLKLLPCAVLFIHHHRKTIKFFTGTLLESIRGSSDIGAELESHLAVDQMDSKIRVTQGKNRRGVLQKPFTITPIVTDTSITFQYEGEVEEEVSKKEVVKNLVLNLFSTKSKWLKQDVISNLDGEAGQRTVEDVLKFFVKEGVLLEDWEGQKRIYELSQEHSQSAKVPISLLEQSYLKEADNFRNEDQ